jgi:hypothetical protein
MFQGNFIYYFLFMRISLIAAALLILASCTMPWGAKTPVATPQTVVTTQSDSPAARFCLAHSGSVSLEANPAIPTMELIYCTVGGEKVDAWKYMEIQTTATGATGSGMPL